MDLKSLAAFAEAYGEATANERYDSLFAGPARKLADAYLRLNVRPLDPPASIDRYVLAIEMAKGAPEEDRHAVETLIDNASKAFARALFALHRQTELTLPEIEPAPDTPRSDAPAPAAEEGQEF